MVHYKSFNLKVLADGRLAHFQKSRFVKFCLLPLWSSYTQFWHSLRTPFCNIDKCMIGYEGLKKFIFHVILKSIIDRAKYLCKTGHSNFAPFIYRAL